VSRESVTQRVVEVVEGRLRARLSPSMLRWAYRAGYLVLRPWWFLTRPRTLGVKSVVRCGDQVLLVRHTYARRKRWDLPGGFLRPGEDPGVALRRELREELGVEPVAVMPIAQIAANVDSKRERLYAYVADVEGLRVTPSAAEIADARWVHRDALPPSTMRFARRMIARSYWELWDDPAERMAPTTPKS
jgi:ADP-ribose pyrophosphatase YjhB (NUDIX family)